MYQVQSGREIKYAFYNTSFGKDELFWLDFLYSRSAQRAETHK